MNDRSSNKTIQAENFSNSFQNFYISKNGSYANSNANFHLQNFTNNKNNYIINNNSSKPNFIHKGNENSENIPPNCSENTHFKALNSVSDLKQKQGFNTKNNSKVSCEAKNPTPNTDINLPLSLVHEKQIPFDYIFEIWSDFRSSELLFPCIPKYNHIVNSQKEISFETRAILLDWLIDVQIHFKSSNETLFLCFSLVDAYLALKEISKKRLQLMGITAFSIACKYEEIYPPYLKDLVNITDNTFSDSEILKMESEILNLLHYHFTFPTCFSFWQMISYQFKLSQIEFDYGCFLMEMYALHPNFNKYLPSLIALAVAYLVLKSKKYERYRDLYQLINNGHTESELKICAREIYDFNETLGRLNFKAVTRKYSSEKFNYVAINGLKGN